MAAANRIQWLNGDVKSLTRTGKTILYWMFRDFRAEDNWGLAHAQSLAKQHDCSLAVVVTVVPNYIERNLRHHHFLLHSLTQVGKSLETQNISFNVQVTCDPKATLLGFAEDCKAKAVVTDFMPLRDKMNWDKVLGVELGDVPLIRVDAHNIIPCWETSPKREYAARTIRPKIMNRLNDFLAQVPPSLTKMTNTGPRLCSKFNANTILDELKTQHKIDCSANICDEFYPPGADKGLKRFKKFLSQKRLGHYSTLRNDPTHSKVISGLSPYFNHGLISIRSVIVEAREYAKGNKIPVNSIEGFVEEAVVRRELSDNFCYYNENYDNLKGCYDWARKTLKDHSKDKREHVYSYKELAAGKTHDDLWNASQKQLSLEGKLHGFLRMYWAKKILEWTESPKQALKFAQKLNDYFAIDGNDPNGYVGVGWSIMGIHDQGWREREVFGKIRYMNYAGCKRKFDVAKFVSKYNNRQLEKSLFKKQKKRKLGE